jgi:hypothetical protein
MVNQQSQHQSTITIFCGSGKLVYPSMGCPVVQMLKANKTENISQDNGEE